MLNMTIEEQTWELAYQFNNIAIHEKSLVRIRVHPKRNSLASFEIYYKIEDDPFVRLEVYEDGCAVIYPTDRVEEVLLSLAKKFDKTIGWNNTRTRGWLQ